MSAVHIIAGRAGQFRSTILNKSEVDEKKGQHSCYSTSSGGSVWRTKLVTAGEDFHNYPQAIAEFDLQDGVGRRFNVGAKRIAGTR
jgi:hypothetical protein